MTDQILDEIRDGRLIITLNRPRAINALSVEMFRRLHELIDYAEDEDDIRVVVLKAAGEKGFCAGLDTKQLVAIRESGGSREMKEPFKLLYSLCKRIDALPKLVISVVFGHCIAAGAQLATSADIILAGESLKLLENEMRSGGFNDDSWPERLGRTLGPVRAKSYVFLMETLNAQEALALGLVSKVLPDADLDSYAETMTAQMAGYHPPAVKMTLRMIDKGSGA